MTSLQSIATHLPAGFIALRELTRPGAIERVLQGELNGRPVALRVARIGAGAESLAELAVLAAVEHPGLAALVGHGSLPANGGNWVAREWIDGCDLATWTRGSDAKEIGRMVARMCPALDHLHQRGFVHGDLKPSNVIVASDGGEARPVITDFGLATRARSPNQVVSGSFFGLAPELLVGGQVDARADLFALGVMLHELLVRRRATARDFYGRFPAFDFFEATDTAREDLPEWARDVLAALLEREPGLRPASAADVGRTLAGRLGLRDLFRAPRASLRFPIVCGRETWIEAWIPGQRRLDWLVAGLQEDVEPLCDELALRAALHGSSVQRVELGGELGSPAAIDRWAVRTCTEHPAATLFVALPRSDARSTRVIDALARALQQQTVSRPASVVAVAAHEPALSQLEWRVLQIPVVSRDAVREWLRENVIGDAEQIERWATALAESTRGSAAAIDAALQRCARDGSLLAGEERPRLRPGAEPESVLDSSSAAPAFGRRGERLLAAVRVCGNEATLDEAAEVAQLSERALGEALSSLIESSCAVAEHGARTTRVRLTPFGRSAAMDRFDETELIALHERRAQQLRRAGAPRARQLPHRLRARQATVVDVAEECQRLRDQGYAELALELADTALAHARQVGLRDDADLIGELALAWVALGQPDRALDAIASLPAESAVAQRTRGQIASLRHEPATAFAHFERARELDPHDGGYTALAEARLLYDLQHDREVIELVDRARANAAGLQPRLWAHLLAVHAMSLFRTGEIARARELLQQFVADARSAGDATREAALSINLAILERRAGDSARAIELVERSAELYDQLGNATGLAQARAMLGSTLRDLGELPRAQPLLQSALAMRERLGDPVGAAAVRGMLALTLAERGHARAAIEELEKSASALRQSRRSRDAGLLEARAEEMRVRLGHRSPASQAASPEADRTAEGDPRTLASLARAAWLRGDEPRARDYARRAVQLASSLGLSGLLEEAQFLLRRLDGDAPQPTGGASTLVDQDQELIALLSQAPFDFARARQLAGELTARGRDDRAARAWLAVASRVAADAGVAADWQHVEEAFAHCARGCTNAESDALRRTLLGAPDPWPEDVVAWDLRRASPEEDEMEVVRLLEINHRLVAQDDLKSLLGTIVEQALAVSGAQRGFLILEEDGELEVDTAMDSRRGGIDAPEVEISGSVLREALERMKPMRVSNAVDDPLFGAAPSVISLELRSILCVPFDVQKGLRGVIYLDHRLREGAFDARVERMLSLLADQAALAIAQVRRLEEIRRLNRELGRQMARKESDLRTATEALRAARLPRPGGGLVGSSPVMKNVRALIERAAQSKLTALVTGPSGSGKELAARALHDLGPRSDGPFVSENCAALPGSLIEAELFGARRGAFTGADRDREGLFEQADGGTLFLDEIGELPLDLQAKLLRVLETSQVRRLGDDRVREIDFRLVVATNRDLAREVRDGSFRADLFYRLDGLRIQMPSLAAHPDDIPALVDHCLRVQCVPGGEPRKIAPAVVAKLCRRDWQGNVRELFNEVARLLVLSEGEIADPALVREPERAPPPLASPSGAVLTLDELERQAILRAIEVAGGDKREAAKMLGISRAKVYQRLKEWDEAAANDRPEQT